ncbi:MAG: hypothetical protein HRT54_07235 [Colwellia sp.]|nr:hypothetical protein [Colwellia sp.]
MKLVKTIRMLTVFCTGLVIITQAEEVKLDNTASKTAKKTLIIESKVTGSQEQPKVLYIMPWQGIANPISIKDKKTQLAMPEFKPINPKLFRQEVREFAAKQAGKKQAKNAKNAKIN